MEKGESESAGESKKLSLDVGDTLDGLNSDLNDYDFEHQKIDSPVGRLVYASEELQLRDGYTRWITEDGTLVATVGRTKEVAFVNKNE